MSDVVRSVINIQLLILLTQCRPSRIYRRRMAIAGIPAPLTRLRTDLLPGPPPAAPHSPATTEAALMVSITEYALICLTRSPF